MNRFALCGIFGLFLSFGLPVATESAGANGDTRTLHLYNIHTNETISATYRVNGHYNTAVLEKLNWFLRDWRRNEATHMDPRLFDVIWETYREAGATAPIHVVCGYRSPRTNAMLRRRSKAVARRSQHMLGKAMDTTMPGMSMEKVREVAMRLQSGGVGFYGDSGFVHIDVGGVRYWPRMTYAQLSRVFPDGKTVLIPTNGKPLRGYEEARAELAASGRVSQVPPSEKAGSFFAWLFGVKKGGVDEHEEEAMGRVAAPGSSTQSGAIAAAGRPQPVEPAGESKIMQVAARSASDRPTSAAMPFPSSRPGEFFAFANVLLPPGRPTHSPLMMASLRSRVADKDGSMAGDPVRAGAAVPAPHPVGPLPTIITHGANEEALVRRPDRALQARSHVLAYAPQAQIEDAPSGSHSNMHLGVRVGWAAAAADLKAPRASEMTKLDKQTILSPALTGLRRAARIETAGLLQKSTAGYLARFAKVATDLPTDHFSGPAVVGLREAGRRRMIYVDGAAALKNGN